MSPTSKDHVISSITLNWDIECSFILKTLFDTVKIWTENHLILYIYFVYHKVQIKIQQIFSLIGCI